LGWVVASVLMFAIVGMAGVFVGLKYFSRDLPDYSQLANYEPPITTRFYAGDGRLLAEYATEKRSFVPFEAIPDMVVQAFISAEDQHYFDHKGVDPIGVARAAVTNIRNIGTGRRPIGASTITQQVARNFLLTNELAIERKVREALLAFRIERAYSKEKILELYLNQIYLGRGSYGVAAAALNYFNKSLPELTLEEAAYLAALPKAPNNYHPIHQRGAAIARRNYVIERMLEDGAISEGDAVGALSQDLVVRQRDNADVVTAEYFAEDVRRQMVSLYGENALYQGGLSVRTTLDAQLQRQAEQAMREGLLGYDRRHGWRGPIATFEEFDNWAGRLAQIAQPAGAGSWILALALEVEDSRTILGFADGTQGIMQLEDMRWARPWLPEQEVGPAPSRTSDVLNKGDVVLVSRLPGQEGLTPLPIIGRDEGAETLPGSAVLSYALEQIPDVQGALVAIDPHTGRVKAMVGGFDYEMSEFNRATQAARQPGSAFKPFVYLAALTQGYTPTSLLLDTPLAIDQGEELEIWKPENYSGDFLGPTPMRVGIEKSRNLMTVRLLQDIGLEPVRDIAQNFGVMERMPLLYAMGLGAGEVTLLDLTTAYAMLVNGGKQIEPSLIDRVQNRQGRSIYKH
ncbi:MAG: transglycosylase domain-containing protein, partial [Pseudomonadota bacterium]